MTENKPKQVIKAGGVRAAIWENTITRNGTQIPMHIVQIDRSYKDGEAGNAPAASTRGICPRSRS